MLQNDYKIWGVLIHRWHKLSCRHMSTEVTRAIMDAAAVDMVQPTDGAVSEQCYFLLDCAGQPKKLYLCHWSYFLPELFKLFPGRAISVYSFP